MNANAQVTCPDHGEQDQTFVCQHIAGSLATGVAVGFHWPRSTPDQARPDAWCAQCENARIEAGGEWTDELGPQLSIKLLCGGCYDKAKDIWANYRAEVLKSRK